MNKKIIKTIVGITLGLGIVSSVPYLSTSCSENEEEGEKELRVKYDHSHFAGDYKIDGFSGD